MLLAVVDCLVQGVPLGAGDGFKSVCGGEARRVDGLRPADSPR